VHQSLASKAPTYRTSALRVPYLPAHNRLVSEHGLRFLHSSSNRTLAVPRTRSTFGLRSFASAGPRMWNSLPTIVRQMTSYGQFWRHLKSHLFRDFQKSKRSVTLILCDIQIHLLTYLLTRHNVVQKLYVI